MFAPYRYSRDVGIPSRTVCFNLFSPRSFLDREEILIEFWFGEYKIREKVCTSMVESIILSNVDTDESI